MRQAEDTVARCTCEAYHVKTRVIGEQTLHTPFHEYVGLSTIRQIDSQSRCMQQKIQAGRSKSYYPLKVFIPRRSHSWFQVASFLSGNGLVKISAIMSDDAQGRRANDDLFVKTSCSHLRETLWHLLRCLMVGLCPALIAVIQVELSS